MKVSTSFFVRTCSVNVVEIFTGMQQQVDIPTYPVMLKSTRMASLWILFKCPTTRNKHIRIQRDAGFNSRASFFNLREIRKYSRICFVLFEALKPSPTEIILSLTHISCSVVGCAGCDCWYYVAFNFFEHFTVAAPARLTAYRPISLRCSARIGGFCAGLCGTIGLPMGQTGAGIAFESRSI